MKKFWRQPDTCKKRLSGGRSRSLPTENMTLWGAFVLRDIQSISSIVLIPRWFKRSVGYSLGPASVRRLQPEYLPGIGVLQPGIKPL
jgi:hypothetical protein